jgi:hypothetical protein
MKPKETAATAAKGNGSNNTRSNGRPSDHGQPRPDPARVKARLAENAKRYKRNQAGRRKSFSMVAVLIKDVRRVLRLRDGRVLPDTELAVFDLKLLAWLMAHRRGGERVFRNVVALEAPWLDGPKCDRMWAEAIAKTRAPTPIEISEYLELTWDERCEAGVRNVPAIDAKGDDLRKRKADRRRQLDRERQRRRRRRAKQDAMSREEYVARALSTARPWEDERISRRTWYRRRKRAAETARPSTR